MKTLAILFATLLSSFVLAVVVRADPGSLDTSFASAGKICFGFGAGQDYGHAVAVQGDGKLVVAGSSGLTNAIGGNFAVVRYDTNNMLDSTFGMGGKVVTSIGSAEAVANAVKIQADNKIVLAGYSGAGTNHDFTLARYNPDGSLDSSFGANGIVITDFGLDDYGQGMVIQSDGKIVVVGYTAVSAGANGKFALARYNGNGTLDSSFGAGGKAITDIAPNAKAGAVSLQADGKIIVAGGFPIKVARYNANGTVDSSFGTGGMVQTAVGASSGANAVAMQFGNNTQQNPDKIVVA